MKSTKVLTQKGIKPRVIQCLEDRESRRSSFGGTLVYYHGDMVVVFLIPVRHRCIIMVTGCGVPHTCETLVYCHGDMVVVFHSLLLSHGLGTCFAF